MRTVTETSMSSFIRWRFLAAQNQIPEYFPYAFPIGAILQCGVLSIDTFGFGKPFSPSAADALAGLVRHGGQFYFNRVSP
jgi:hypothetical protein